MGETLTRPSPRGCAAQLLAEGTDAHHPHLAPVLFAEQGNRRSRSKPSYPLPEKFLKELETMPPAAGIALGVDRLVMVMLDAPTIDDVIAFTPEEL